MSQLKVSTRLTVRVSRSSLPGFFTSSLQENGCANAAASSRLGLPFVPGTANPSDVEIGLELGCKLLKFFPAEALGGAKLLSAIYAPYKHTGVKFMPTGGVTADNLESYLSLPAVAAVGGTWIAKPADIAAGNWDAIAARCRAAREVVARVRAAV